MPNNKPEKIRPSGPTGKLEQNMTAKEHASTRMLKYVHDRHPVIKPIQWAEDHGSISASMY
jgi:hypothetical protein